MKPRTKLALVGLMVAVALIVVIAFPSGPLFDRLTAYKIERAKEADRRVVLINSTLSRPAAFWNRRYVREALRADTLWERRYIADLLERRLGSNAVFEIESLLSKTSTPAQYDNIQGVISALHARPTN